MRMLRKYGGKGPSHMEVLLTFTRGFFQFSTSQRKGDLMTIKVVHCKKSSYDIYIGRPSKWGNPFSIGKHGTREEVISKYEAYIMDNSELLKALPELKGKILGCWCTPKACHGDVLKIMVEDKIWEK